MHVCVHVHQACVRAFARVCVRLRACACVCACVRVCVCARVCQAHPSHLAMTAEGALQASLRAKPMRIARKEWVCSAARNEWAKNGAAAREAPAVTHTRPPVRDRMSAR